MNTDMLLDSLKSTLNIQNEVKTFDSSLLLCLKGAVDYVNSILDDKDDALGTPLYILTVVHLSAFYWLNRDNSRITSLPVTINSLLNRLKDRYSD